MKAKYCFKESPLKARSIGRYSPTWKRLLRVRGQANPYIRWVIGQGEIYFWDDVWLGDTPLREHSLDDRGAAQTKVVDFMRNGAWDEAKLRLLQFQAGLPHRAITQILDMPISPGEPDIPRWSLSRLGDFSMSTTWETIRARRPRIQGLEEVWMAGLSKSIAIFNWRLLSNRIPVDSKLQWRNIEMASKCQCCPQRPNRESLQHLFIQGWGAIKVWREFDGWFEGSSPPIRINDTIPERLEVWSRRCQQQGAKHLSRTMPYLIFWFLWAERNQSRHDQVSFKPFNVIWQVQMFIRNSMESGGIRQKHWSGVRPRMEIPGRVEAGRPRPVARLVKWHPPDPPWIKLNTDGAFMAATNQGGGGGIIRDHHGKMLVAFAVPFVAHSALEAELTAIYHGLMVAKDFNKPIWIESDAKQAINLLEGSAWGPAHIRHVMARLRVLKKQHTTRASFTHREGNKAADFLAKMGLEQTTLCRMSIGNAPRLLKAMVRLDEMGLPNLRLGNEDQE